VTQTRELSYRIDPHFHPYVQALTQRLIHGSVAGLQAADTDYLPGGESLPDSIVVELAAEQATITVVPTAELTLTPSLTSTPFIPVDFLGHR
jgi:hypothetical protein